MVGRKKQFSKGTTMKRLDIHEYFTLMALVASTRATCVRRKVGAVITDDFNKVLSTGYNGPPKGALHCIGHTGSCEAELAKPGMNLDGCRAIHAEVNAIAQCSDLRYASTLYVTTSPCISCMKALAATNIEKIVYLEKYEGENGAKALEYWCNEIHREAFQISQSRCSRLIDTIMDDTLRALNTATLPV